MLTCSFFFQNIGRNDLASKLLVAAHEFCRGKDEEAVEGKSVKADAPFKC